MTPDPEIVTGASRRMLDLPHAQRLKAWAAERMPDLSLGDPAAPYMRRWIIHQGLAGATYLHHFLAPDGNRDPHDHTADNATLVLDGGYLERLGASPGGPTIRRGPGDHVIRRAEDPHAIVEIAPGGCWTLWRRGPKAREWGFHTPAGWVRWSEYVDPLDPDRIAYERLRAVGPSAAGAWAAVNGEESP